MKKSLSITYIIMHIDELTDPEIRRVSTAHSTYTHLLLIYSLKFNSAFSSFKDMFWLLRKDMNFRFVLFY